MYHQYFGLNEAPFSIAVNPRYLFMSARHRDALAHLLYGVGAGGGFILLTGEVGTGNTPINRCLLEQLPHDTDIAIILNPALNAMELLATACDELGIPYDADRHTLKTLTDSLHAFLLANHEKGRKTVLMIDEAQHLDFDVLEQIRLLTNLETNSEKLLQIILIGQPELAQLLARPELRQLNQRITARYNLEPLNLSETGAYIHHRLQVAGMTPDREIFPPAVVRGVYRRTRGIPRLINVLCDRILLGAYGRNKHKADMATLRLAAAEVLGEEEKRGASRYLVTAAVLVAAVAIGAWWWGRQDRLPEPAAPAPAAAQVATPAQALEPRPAAAAEPVEVQPVEAQRIPDAIAPPQTSWLMPPGDARELLWSYSSSEPPPAKGCDSPGQFACLRANAATWDELAAIDRPLLLELVRPDRFAAAAILLGQEGRRAWLASPDGPVLVELAELAPLWGGDYVFLWRIPAGFDKPLALGDNSDVVAQVAALFARLDGQQRALAGENFNAALRQRVVMFQQARGLEADGVVGVQTLLELNEVLGLDASASAVLRAYRQDEDATGG